MKLERLNIPKSDLWPTQADVWLGYPIGGLIAAQVIDLRPKGFSFTDLTALVPDDRLIISGLDDLGNRAEIQIVTARVRAWDPGRRDYAGETVAVNGPFFRYHPDDTLVASRQSFCTDKGDDRRRWVISTIARGLGLLPDQVVKGLIKDRRCPFLILRDRGTSLFWIPKQAVCPGGHQGVWIGGEMKAWESMRGATGMISGFTGCLCIREPVVIRL